MFFIYIYSYGVNGGEGFFLERDGYDNKWFGYSCEVQEKHGIC